MRSFSVARGISPAMNTERQTDEEEALLVAHKHWAAFVPATVLSSGPAVLFAVLWSMPEASTGPTLHALFTLLLPPGLLVTWTILAVLWTSHFLDMLIVTDRRIFYSSQEGLFRRSIGEWDIRRVQRVSVRIDGALESLFSYGAVEVELEGGESVVLESMPNPEYISAVIMKQDDVYGELKKTAQEQKELLHFISHEVKGHLTKSKAAFAAIAEGDYGPVPQQLDSLARAALEDSQKGVETVMSVLDRPDWRHGAPPLQKRPFDFSETVRRTAEVFSSGAKEKGLRFSVSVDNFCAMVGDERQLGEHVLRNLFENALRYTPSGGITVTLKKAGATARLSVADTGVGIPAGDMGKLFTEGGHGEHSKEVNPDSTGFGLFIAKKIVEAHGGRVWAESAGPRTGATFFVELPLA